MLAIQVLTWGQAPVFIKSVPPPAAPAPDTGFVQIKVVASGLHNLVRTQSSGQHYSMASVLTPYIPGTDGVGYSVPDNRLVYFSSATTGGAFAERVNVPRAATVPLPVDDSASKIEQHRTAIRIAALMNPALSSWMALKTRITDLANIRKKDFSVLILGATSLSGRIAISIARNQGASKVIGAARSRLELEKLNLDHAIVLEDRVAESDFSILKTIHVDIILDYVCGDTISHVMNALPSIPPKAQELATQVIQIGSLGGGMLQFDGATLRSRNISLKGSGPGSWSLNQLKEETPELIGLLIKSRDIYGVKERTLDEADEAFADTSRTVFVVG